MTKRKSKKAKKQKKGIFNKIPKEYTMALLIFMGVFISVVAVSLMISKTDVSRSLKTEIANFPGGPLCITENGDCSLRHDTTVNLAKTGKYKVEVTSVRGYSSTNEACQHTCQTNEEFDVYVDNQLLGRAIDKGPGCPNGMMPIANCAHDNGERTTTDHHVLGEFNFNAGSHTVSAVHPIGTGNNSTGSVDAGSVVFTFIDEGEIPPKDCYYNSTVDNWQYDSAATTCNSGQNCDASALKTNYNVGSAQECIEWCTGQKLEYHTGVAACQFWDDHKCALMLTDALVSWDGVQAMYMEYTPCGCDDDCSANGSNGHCESGLNCINNTCRNSACETETDCVCPYCGDGVLDEGEECEPGVIDCEEEQACTNDCICEGAGPYCGDGVVDAGEECEPGVAGYCGDEETCTNDCICEGVSERVASIEIIKTADRTSVDPGTTVNYEFEVTNTGTEDLTSVTATDPLISDIVCPQDTLDANCPVDDIIINPDICLGESMICTGSMVITEDTVNTATAKGTDPEGNDVTDSDDEEVTVILESGIEIIKTADQTSVDPGIMVNYEFVVTNTGDTTLTNVAVTDPLISNVSCPKTTLTSGSSMICTGSMVITEDTVNTATAKGTDPDGNDVTDSDDEEVTVILESGIEIIKTADQTSVDPGTTVDYEFVVTNIGDTTLTNVTVTDPLISDISCPQTTLISGSSMICTGSMVVDEDTINTATATGTDPDGGDVTDSDIEEVEVEIDAGINIEKTVNKTTINKGETVTYIFVVTNTGNVRLTDIEADDNKLGKIDCPYSALDSGDSMTCTQKAIVNVTTTNVVVVTAEDPEGNEIDDRDVEQVEVEEPTDQDCNEECDDDDNCDDDLVCHNGRCRNDECKGESDCECDCNDDCDDDDDCEDDLECEDGRCRNPECEDESDCECDCDDDCEDDDDCESGLDCEDGKCRNPYCEDEDDCVCKRSPTTGMGRNVAIVFSISVAITAIILLVLHKTGRFTVGK